MTPVFEVVICKARHTAIVTKDGDKVWGPAKISQAEQKRDELVRMARRKRRNCMVCRDEFMSEGAHNRLCAKCRRMGATAETVAV